MADLTGKVVVVTAAAQGIGRASALAFAKAGAIVNATDINEVMLAELGKTSGIKTRKLDVLNDEAVTSAFAEIGPVDVLFNCAGFVHSGSILEMKDGDLDFAYDLNVRSMIRTIRAVLPGMLERGDGSIINMSSLAGSTKGVPNRFVYGLTKAAVIGLTKSIAADYVGKGIRCNAICPGTVETPSLQQRIAALGDVEKARAAFIARQPMGRLGTVEDIMGILVFLASDESLFATGNAYSIDGGMTI